jgi:hypothetical protein
MQRKKRIIGFGFSKISPYVSFISFSLVFVIGVLIGTIIVGRFRPILDFASRSIHSYINVRENGEIISLITGSVNSVLPYYIVVFLLGTSIIGFVASPLVLLYRGILFGAVSGFMYFTYKLEGVIFCLLILIPSVLVSVFGLICLAKEAFSFSYRLGGICIKTTKPINISSHFRNYYLQSALTLIPAVCSMILDVGMSALFIGFFDF